MDQNFRKLNYWSLIRGRKFNWTYLENAINPLLTESVENQMRLIQINISEKKAL